MKTTTINANTQPVKMDKRMTESQSAVFSAVIYQHAKWRAMMLKSGVNTDSKEVVK
jgi:hypothetical protein